ncbi:MAG: single-stranded DNA-binding protein [Eubacterium sp.]|nr:single-stranded DNA-binding protein [Eubacterium sp.]
MLNAVHLMGRLTADPEFHQTETYKASRFTLAVSRDYKNKETGEREADFIRITAWGGLADFVCSYFKKGSLIAVSGNLRTRHYTDKDGNKRVATEVVASDVYFAGSNKASSDISAADEPLPETTSDYADVPNDDDYPF